LFNAVYSATAVIPRECGVSSTPPLHGSITSVSGILDHRWSLSSGRPKAGPGGRVLTTEAVMTAEAEDDGRSRR